MEVTLLDGSIHDVDPIDVALLSQRTEINVPSIYSKDIFWRFSAFMKRQDLNLDQKLIDQWNIQFMEEIMDTDTLHDLIMLACKTRQKKLLDVCSKRVADMLKARLSGEVAELLNLPNPGEEDEEGDEEEDEDEDDPLLEVPIDGSGDEEDGDEEDGDEDEGEGDGRGEDDDMD